jgi:hypothetical protein
MEILFMHSKFGEAVLGNRVYTVHTDGMYGNV